MWVLSGGGGGGAVVSENACSIRRLFHAGVVLLYFFVCVCVCVWVRVCVCVCGCVCACVCLERSIAIYNEFHGPYILPCACTQTALGERAIEKGRSRDVPVCVRVRPQRSIRIYHGLERQ